MSELKINKGIELMLRRAKPKEQIKPKGFEINKTLIIFSSSLGSCPTQKMKFLPLSENRILTIKVVENPIINEVEFKGIKSKKLKEKIYKSLRL